MRTWEETYCTYASTFLQFHEVPCSHLLERGDIFLFFFDKVGTTWLFTYTFHASHLPGLTLSSPCLWDEGKRALPPSSLASRQTEWEIWRCYFFLFNGLPYFSQLLKGIKTA